MMLISFCKFVQKKTTKKNFVGAAGDLGSYINALIIVYEIVIYFFIFHVISSFLDNIIFVFSPLLLNQIQA